jgi:hypothetical protein
MNENPMFLRHFIRYQNPLLPPFNNSPDKIRADSEAQTLREHLTFVMSRNAHNYIALES